MPTWYCYLDRGLALSVAVYCLDIVLLTNAMPEIVKIKCDLTSLTANGIYRPKSNGIAAVLFLITDVLFFRR
jgi:hypothetical protein